MDLKGSPVSAILTRGKKLMKKFFSLSVTSIVLAVVLCFTAMPLIKYALADSGSMKGCTESTQGNSDSSMKSCQHDAKNQAQFQGQLVIVQSVTSDIVHDFFRSVLEISFRSSYEDDFLIASSTAPPEISSNDYLAYSTKVVIRT